MTILGKMVFSVAVCIAAWSFGCGDDFSGPGGNGGGGAGGQSGGSAGEGGAAGFAGTGGAEDSDGGLPCGGIIALQCPVSSYCDYGAPNRCGAADILGTCRPRPQACSADCPGVCGCDGKFYCNACLAHVQGFDDSIDNGCRPDASMGCQTDDQCESGYKCCVPCGASGGCSKECLKPDPSGRCPLFP